MNPNSSPPLSPQADRLRQVLTIVAIVGTLGVNVLSNLFPLNGLNIGELSNTLFAEVKVIPANYAFAIWGVIYLGLIAFGVYQLQPSQQQNPDLRRSSYWLVVACAAQAIWVYLFLSRQFLGSVIAMLVILLSLVMMYLRLGIGKRRPRQERWLVQIPISIYLGWITVATVVNVASALYAAGWQGGGISAQSWTVIMIGISAAIAAIVAIQRKDIAFTLVIVWALIAIAVRQSGSLPIVITAVGFASGLVLLLLFQWFQEHKTA